MDIEHLGEATIAALVERRLVRDVADLYRLRPSEVRRLPGFGPRAAGNLLAAIAASRRRGLARLLHALGIRLVGAHVAGLLAGRYRSLDRLAGADASELVAIPGIGPAIAESIAKFFAEGANRDVCRRLGAAGVSTTTDGGAGPARGPLAGRTFVLTGTLSGLTRGEAEERIRSRGGRVTATVSRHTDHLVAGAAPGAKLARARARGVPVLDEEAFLAVLRGSSSPDTSRRSRASDRA
jgi:DNA ligase (NAD+)